MQMQRFNRFDRLSRFLIRRLLAGEAVDQQQTDGSRTKWCELMTLVKDPRAG